MSEETAFFRKKEGSLQARFENSFAFGGLMALPVTAIGAILTGWNLAKKESIAAGASVTALGAAAFVGNLFYKRKLAQEFLDLDACKLGLLPKEDLGVRHVHLSQEQRTDLQASIDAGDAVTNTRRHNGLNADKQVTEARDEAVLEAARTEWRRRVQLRTQTIQETSKF